MYVIVTKTMITFLNTFKWFCFYKMKCTRDIIYLFLLFGWKFYFSNFNLELRKHNNCCNHNKHCPKKAEYLTQMTANSRTSATSTCLSIFDFDWLLTWCHFGVTWQQIGPSRALRRTSPVHKRTFTFPPEVACRIPTSVRLKDNGMFPALLCSLLLLHGSLGEIVFRCPSCTAERQAACPKLSTSCEIVREPGCGCCPVCARQKGELCGVYTPRCGSGLRCYPTVNSELPLEQLIQGRGRCENKVDLEPTMPNQESGHSGESQDLFVNTNWCTVAAKMYAYRTYDFALWCLLNVDFSLIWEISTESNISAGSLFWHPFLHHLVWLFTAPLLDHQLLSELLLVHLLLVLDFVYTRILPVIGKPGNVKVSVKMGIYLGRSWELMQW